MEKEHEEQKEEGFSDKFKNYIRNLFDFSEFEAKTIGFIILFVILVIVSLYLLYYIYFVDETFLYRLVVDLFVNPIFLLGFWGIFLFLIIMGIQGLLVPIPSEIVLLAAGMIWGIVWGGIMGVIGSMTAGLLCFYISKKGGRPLAEKFVGADTLEMADNIIHKYGTGAIIIARFLPFVAFDPISYASGLVDMDIKKYSFGTLLGSIPRAFFYSFLGASLGINPPIDFKSIPLNEIEEQAAYFNQVLFIILAVLVVIFALYYLANKYYLPKLRAKKKAE